MKVSIRVTGQQSILLFFSILSTLFLAIVVSVCDYSITKYIFAALVVLVYLLTLPKRLMNPKNVVFFFYFMWYVLAPIFGSRYDEERVIPYWDKANIAFLMCYVVYVTAMVTLDLSLGRIDRSEPLRDNIPKQTSITRCITMLLLFSGMYFFIQHSGGLSLWLSNAYAAQFNRRGSGQYFLVYSMAFVVLAFFAGQDKNKKKVLRNRIIFVVFIMLNFELLGSKLTVITLFMLLFADMLIKSDLFSKWTILLGVSGVVVFIAGLIVRLGSFQFAMSYALNYFDTFENLGTLMKDYSAGFLTTFIMPFLWPFIKLGLVNQEFYDFSVWLTTQYTPDTWYIGQGSNQWNIESDMYLNYYFFGGIPLIILYFVIIAFLYKKARTTGGVWKLIYIYEATLIISHLRGGIFIFWYWYLIPLYIWLIIRYAPDSKIKIKTNRTCIMWKRAED